MAEKRKSGLGRGLAALLEEVEAAPAAAVTGGQGPTMLPIEQIHSNPDQPRAYFDKEKLEELARSIADKGVLQPIVVRPAGPDRYEIVAGERRWRAAQLARLHEMPVVVRSFNEQEALSVAIIENIQRHDLNALEEARAYVRLMEEFGHTHDEVAKVVGKSRSHITNLIRLLDLPRKAQGYLMTGQLSMSHARALLMAPDPEEFAEEVVARGYSVRQTEARAIDLARAAPRPAGQGRAARPAARGGAPVPDADIAALERNLSDLLGLKVGIEHSGTTGRVTIRYTALDQLDLVCQRLAGGRI